MLGRTAQHMRLAPGADLASAARRAVSDPRPVVLLLGALAVLLPAFASAGDLPAGDGALHIDLSRQIAESRSLATDPASHYPPLFHVFGAAAYSIAGELGVRLISYVAFGLISVFTYLVARQLGFDVRLALGAQLLVTLSPLFTWYAGLTLMEPALVASVMITVYVALLYAEERTLKLGIALVVAISAMLLIKQTAAPVAVAALLYVAFFPRFNARNGALIAVGVLLVIAVPYWRVMQNTGAFIDLGQPSLTETERAAERLPGSLLIGDWVERQPAWSLELEQDVDSAALYERGTVTHEQRKVSIRDVFDWPKMAWIHSLYPSSLNGRDFGSLWPTTLFVNTGLLLGLVSLPTAIRNRPAWALIALTLFISYFAMEFGSDSKRLYLFVTALSAPLVVLGYRQAWRVMARYRPLAPRAARYAAPAGVCVVAVLVIAAIPQVSSQYAAVGEVEDTQGGGFPSAGGMASLIEAADWINANSNPGDTFVAASVYEWEFYSDRQDLWDEGLDFRLYFLDPELVRYYLERAKARYVVIRSSQVVSDDEWSHIEQVPDHFVATIESSYPLVYETITSDIKIYEVNA